MKSIKFIIFVWVLSFCISCSKSEDAIVNPYFLSCKINGTVYKVEGETAAFATLKTPETYWIYGKEATTGKELYVRIELSKGLGTFPMKGLTQASFLDTDKTNYHTNFNSGTGEVTLSEQTTTSLKGKFSFTANTFTSPIKKAVVTEGEFFVPIK
jgi:hypothetical protein